jgi:trans-2,3-dihydro-3-hydroxyanthranilate isomerase
MFERHIPTDRATGILLCVPSSDDTASIHCRMFAPLHGVTEDPATGSAAVALIGLLAALDPSPDEELTRTLIQGEDMGRPSRLEAAARKAGSKVEATYVGGACVPVMKGVIDVV